MEEAFVCGLDTTAGLSGCVSVPAACCLPGTPRAIAQPHVPSLRLPGSRDGALGALGGRVPGCLSLCFSAEPWGRFGLASSGYGASYLLAPLADAAAWLLLELLEGCARHSSSVVRGPKQGWLATRARSHRLGQHGRPSQLALAENQEKSSIAPACRVFRPGGVCPVMGLRRRVTYPFPMLQLLKCICRKPQNSKRERLKKGGVFPLISFTFSVHHHRIFFSWGSGNLACPLSHFNDAPKILMVFFLSFPAPSLHATPRRASFISAPSGPRRFYPIPAAWWIT